MPSGTGPSLLQLAACSPPLHLLFLRSYCPTVLLGRTVSKKSLTITIPGTTFVPKKSRLCPAVSGSAACFCHLPHSAPLRKGQGPLRLLTSRPFWHESNIKLGSSHFLKHADKPPTRFKVKGMHSPAHFLHWRHGW